MAVKMQHDVMSSAEGAASQNTAALETASQTEAVEHEKTRQETPVRDGTDPVPDTKSRSGYHVQDESEDSEEDFGWSVGRELRGKRDLFPGIKLEEVRKQARKRLLQSASYSVLVEDRILDLEEKLKELSQAVEVARGNESTFKTADQDEGANENNEKAAIYNKKSASLVPSAPKITWEKYRTPPPEKPKKGETLPQKAVIDLLVERPEPWDQHLGPLTFSYRRRAYPVANRDVDLRIERIRLNSAPLCDVMAGVMGKDVAPPTGSELIRPFKALLVYKDELFSRRQGLQSELSLQDPTTGGASAQLEQDPDPLISAASEKDNEHQGESKSIIESGAQVPAIQSNDTTSKNVIHQGSTTSNGTVEANYDNAIDNSKTNSDAAEDKDNPKLTRADRELQLKHLEVLLNVMEHEMKDIFEKHDSHRSRQIPSVRFDDLWHVFAPGDIVYSPREARAFQLLGVHNGRELLDRRGDLKGTADEEHAHEQSDLLSKVGKNPKTRFCLDLFGIEFDGTVFGLVVSHVYIEPYDGEKKIAELTVFPIEYEGSRTAMSVNRANDAASLDDGLPLREALIQRGRNFQNLANAGRSDHCEYRAMTLDPVPEMVDSHVIIDMSYYYEKHPGQGPVLGLQDISEGDIREIKRFCPYCVSRDCRCPFRDDIHDDRSIEEDRTELFVDDRLGWLRERVKSRGLFEDEQLMMLPGTLWGFVLYSREWHPLDVNKIKQVERSTTSFEQLQITPMYKKLVESQVKMHSTGVKPASGSEGIDEINRRDDLVRGKGKGLIILLHGAPGVGKTSTAECVAEYTNRPLLSITCGDIGDTADEVSKKLEYYLNLAHRWGCVMLLDEADVFLSTRDKRDMKRNAVVSVFLRILEYYSGILFLTTNKVGVVDEAFKSRIHLSLYYPTLDEEQTTAIWRINLRRIKENKPHVTFDEADLVLWASMQWHNQIRDRKQPWNGRQIRNACQTAAALAEFESDSKLTREHLKTIARASSEFDRYLKGVHGTDDAGRAKKNMERRDDYGPPSFEDSYDYHERDSQERYHPYDLYETSRTGYDRDRRDAPGPREPPRNTTYGIRRGPRDDHYPPPRRDDPYYEGDRPLSGRQLPPENYDGPARGRGTDGDDMPPPPRPVQFRRDSESSARREAPPESRRGSRSRGQGRAQDADGWR